MLGFPTPSRDRKQGCTFERAVVAVSGDEHTDEHLDDDEEEQQQLQLPQPRLFLTQCNTSTTASPAPPYTFRV